MARSDPVVLADIMDTIASLQESKGSPPDKILDHLSSKYKTPLKNATLRVKKALRIGTKAGLLKNIGGKFKIGLKPKDFAALKSFRLQLNKFSKKLNLPVIEHRGRRRRGKRRRSRSRRRGRGRRRHSDFLTLNFPDEDDVDEDLVTTKGIKNISTSLPIRELKKRRKARRGSKRRGRRRRRADIEDDDITDADEDEMEPVDKGRRRRRKGRSRRRRGGRRRRHGDLNDGNESVASSFSQNSSIQSSGGKSNASKGEGRGDDERKPDDEKRDIANVDPQSSRTDNRDIVQSNHCIHEHGYQGVVPYPHYPYSNPYDEHFYK